MIRIRETYYVYRNAYRKPVKRYNALTRLYSFSDKIVKVRITKRFYISRKKGSIAFYEYEFLDGEKRFNSYGPKEEFYKTKYHAIIKGKQVWLT